MSKLAVDVNIVLTWLGFQSGELLETATGLFREAKRGKIDLLAPGFLLVELINVLKWRFGQGEKEINRVLGIVLKTGMRFVEIGVEDVNQLVKLVDGLELTAYDAQYLLVAQKTGSKLITLDPELLQVKEWCISLGAATSVIE